MDTISMNSKNSQTYYQHVLLLNPTYKIDLQGGKKSVAISNLSIY